MNPLASFLDGPDRPPGALRYHELQGFLFAVACGPDVVLPSEWMPVVFGEDNAGFRDLEEAQTILPELMALYNDISASVSSERAALPPDCRFRSSLLSNLDEDAPISLWSRGFLRGYQWLQNDWDGLIPDEADHEFAALLVTLSFFTSRDLAAAYLKETGHTDLESSAGTFRRVFPDALAEFARIGRLIQQVSAAHPGHGENPPRLKIGRNEPCPCGSGRKYKKCCGAAGAQ